MAKRLRPESRNPTAAPGRMACAIASPTRLMRRSMRKTPMGPAPSAKASVPASARRMNSNSLNGPMRKSYSMSGEARRLRLLLHAFGGVLVEGLAHASRGEQILRRKNGRGTAPGDRLAGKQQRLGEMRPNELDVVQGSKHGAFFAMPALHQIKQVGGGLGVDRGEGLIEHNDASVMQQQPGKEHALDLPARECRDGAILETGEAYGGNGMLNLLALFAADAAKRAGAAPQPHRHQVVDVDGKRAIDLCGLR